MFLPAQAVTFQAAGPIGRAFQLLLVAVAACAANYARYVIAPLQESIRVSLALNDNQMALLQGPALAIPMVILSIPLGLAIDRYSRARLLRAFAFCSLAGGVLTALASSFSMMLMARAFVGLASLAVPPVALSLIADIYPPNQRGRALMIMTVGQLSGVAGAFALGGKLLASYGGVSTGWQSAMLWLAAPLVPVVLLTLLMRDHRRQSNVSKKAPISSVWKEVWRHRAHAAPLLTGLFMMELAICATLVWTAPAFSRRFTVAPDRIGAAIATAVMVSGLVGSIVGGTLADACQRSGGPRRTLSVVVALTLLDTIAAEFPNLPEWGAATIVFASFLTISTAIMGMATTVFTVVIPEHIRGLFTSILSAGGIIGFGLAPVVVSGVSSMLGGPSTIAHSLAAVCATTSLLSAAVFAFGARSLWRAPGHQSSAENGEVSR